MMYRHFSNRERSAFRALSIAVTSFLLALTLLVPPAAAGRTGPLVDDRRSGESGAPAVVERSWDQYQIDLLEDRKPSSSFDGGNSSNYCYVCYKYR
ncbi:MAG TPA: hypothetical protein VGR22_05250 [Thermomicrobiales bacterium]|nr:hypothetical protein [Thermomicrobiales bacterium]